MGNKPHTPKQPRHKQGRHTVFGVQLAGQVPVLVWTGGASGIGEWRMWLSYDDKYQTGTYFVLEDGGGIRRVVMLAGKIKRQDQVKDSDT